MRLIYCLLITLIFKITIAIGPKFSIGQLIPQETVGRATFSEDNTFQEGELVAYSASGGQYWFARIIRPYA